MLLSLLAGMISCADLHTEGPSTENSPEGSQSEKVELPVRDLNDYEFRAASISANSPFDIWDFDCDEPHAETVLNAIYIRNTKIEEDYNITITNQVLSMDQISSSIRASDDEFDVVFERLGNLTPYISNGNFLDLKEQPYIDLTNPCWDQNSIVDLEIADRVFTATGDIHLSSFDCTWTLYFDYNLIDSLQLTVPYEYVDSNTWTMDVMSTMCKTASQDLNNDMVLDEHDRWGFSTHQGTYPAMIIAAGEKFIAKEDGSDIPKLTMTTERFNDVYSTILRFMHMDDAVYEQVQQKGGYGNNDQVDIFVNGNAIFYAEVMNSIQNVLRTKEGAYGVVPWPKYEEGQDRYYNYVHEAAAGLCIPASTQAPDTVSLIIEAMAEASTETVRHAYYDISMIDKLSRDDRMEDMLDIIFDNRTYEMAFIYNFGSIRDSFYRIAVANSSNLSSYLAAYQDQVKADIAKYVLALQDIE